MKVRSEVFNQQSFGNRSNVYTISAEDALQVIYVAEFQKNIHSMQVYVQFASGEPQGHVEFEVLPTEDGTLTGSKSFIIRTRSSGSQVLPLPAPAKVGHHEVKVVKGHMEIKLEIPALAELPSEPADDLSRLMPADDLKSIQPTSFLCTSCSLPVVHCNDIKDYRDLPSEHWEEFVEAWMCHQDQKLTEEIGRHRQGGFVPDRGVAFVGGSYVLFDDEMVVKENLNTAPSLQVSSLLSVPFLPCSPLLRAARRPSWAPTRTTHGDPAGTSWGAWTPHQEI